MENKDTFHYSYSAEQQEEIRAIREKYLPPEADKMAQLRKLHHAATAKARAWALTVGILGALIMGSGMSLIMTDLGRLLGIGNPFVPGILVGIAGMVLVVLALPVYHRVLKTTREKNAPEILRLTEELLK